MQMLPSGFENLESEPEGSSQSNQTSWTVTLDSGDTATFTNTVRVGEAEEVDGGQLVQVEQSDGQDAAGEKEKQFSSTACVYASNGGDALTCASAYQQLNRDDGSAQWVPWAVGGGVGVAAAAAGGAIWWQRRRTQGDAPQDQEPPAAG